MRAAEGLVDFKSDLVSIFAQIVETHDRYGLHAFLAALENADLRQFLEIELQQSPSLPKTEAQRLITILAKGKFPLAEAVTAAEDTAHPVAAH
jgi:hypothetical protein